MGDRRAIAAALERKIEETVDALIVNATANLIESTPVDTGFARSNWVPSVGQPHEGTVDIGAIRELVRFKLGDCKAYVTNNTAYIRRLNGGSSTQAPSGFVEHAVAQAVADPQP